MLDSFEILTTSGVVLWSKHYAPVSVNIVNSLIRDVFIEDRAATTSSDSAARNPPYKKDKYTLKWTTAKDLGLIFVAVYQSLISLSWIDQLLDDVKTLFTALYGHQFKKPYTSVVECHFDDYFNRKVQELEKQLGRPEVSSAPVDPVIRHKEREDADGFLAPPMPGLRKATPKPAGFESDATATSTEASPIATPESSRPTTPNAGVIVAKAGPGGKVSRKARRAGQTSGSGSRDTSISSKPKYPTSKSKRTWDIDGVAADDLDNSGLDYSTSTLDEHGQMNGVTLTEDSVEQSTWGRRTAQGDFVLKDLDEEMSAILSNAKSSSESTSTPNGLASRGFSSISSAFQNLVGGKKLTSQDLQKPLGSVREHLVQKNVARDAAEHLCAAVERDLIGAKTASFTTIDATVQQSMDGALSKILTPASGSSLDLLRAVQAVKGKRPYVLSLVGVNGVGKSTTLAKLAFLLLHNNLRVLVAAADTFRSGAVEQLRVHVSRLKQLTSSGEGLGCIDLFEKGYGKDAAGIAKDAIAFAASPSSGAPFDVVLVDTAGRRHNDTRLMSSLGVFARQANPDKVLLVCEALVGTDSVAQARHFNESFGGGAKAERGIDGFIVSKCDTVGGMVGTLVSLVWSTGVPVVAVGVGQHYGDLRGFKVAWARDLLLSG